MASTGARRVSAAAAAGPSAAAGAARSVAVSLASRAALVKTPPLPAAMAPLRALLSAALPAAVSDLWQRFRNVSGSGGEVPVVSAAAVPATAKAPPDSTKAAAVEAADEEDEPLPPTGNDEDPTETRVGSSEL